MILNAEEFFEQEGHVMGMGGGEIAVFGARRTGYVFLPAPVAMGYINMLMAVESDLAVEAGTGDKYSSSCWRDAPWILQEHAVDRATNRIAVFGRVRPARRYLPPDLAIHLAAMLYALESTYWDRNLR